MNQVKENSVKPILSALLVAFLYNFGLLSIFFAIPLQLLAAKGEKKGFLLSSLLSIVMILGFRYSVLSAVDGESLVLLDLAILISSMVALYLCNYVLYGHGIFFRVAVATCGIALLSLIGLANGKAIEGTLIHSLNGVFSLMREAYGANGTDLETLFQGKTFYLVLKNFFMPSYLALFFGFILFTWWYGNKLAIRSGKKVVLEGENHSLEVDDHLVWLLFIPLTLYLLDRILEGRGMDFLHGIPYFATTNLLLIVAEIYAIKGFNLLGYLGTRFALPKIRGLLPLLVVVLVTLPGVNTVVFILFAGLGVSELWINYKNIDKE